MIVCHNQFYLVEKEKVLTAQDYLVALFLMTFVVTRIVAIPSLLANSIPALMGLLCFAYTMIHKECTIKLEIIAISLFLTLLEIVGIGVNENNSFYDIVWIWTYIGVASIINTYDLNSKFILFQFYCISSYFVLCMVRGLSADYILSIGSENNLSVYLLLFICLYLYTLSKKTILPYLPIFLTMIVTVWSASRSGITSTVLLLLLAFVYNYTQTKEKKNIAILFIMLLGCFFMQYLVSLDILTESLQAKMNRYGVESTRTLIWREYLNTIDNDFFQFIFGVDLHDDLNYWLSHYGNPHNSFLSLHAHFGLMGVFFMLYIFAVNIIRSFNQRNFLLQIVIVTLVSRCFFDWAAFSGPFDVIFFAMILACFSKKQKLING